MSLDTALGALQYCEKKTLLRIFSLHPISYWDDDDGQWHFNKYFVVYKVLSVWFIYFYLAVYNQQQQQLQRSSVRAKLWDKSLALFTVFFVHWNRVDVNWVMEHHYTIFLDISMGYCEGERWPFMNRNEAITKKKRT